MKEADPHASYGRKTRQQESFPVAWIVAKPLRPAVLATYDFVRAADDLADAPGLTPKQKAQGLAHLRASLLANGHDPLGIAVRTRYAQRGLAVSLIAPLLDAFDFDAQGDVRIPTLQALEDYCTLSAHPIGHFLLALHDQPLSAAQRTASDALCTALQVLNHLQGLREDWIGLGRCYLPIEILSQAGGTLHDLDAPASSPALRMVIDHLLCWVDGLLSRAAPLPGLISARRLAAQAAATVVTARRLRHILAHHDPLTSAPQLARWDWLCAAGASLRPLIFGTSRGLS